MERFGFPLNTNKCQVFESQLWIMSTFLVGRKNQKNRTLLFFLEIKIDH